MGVLKIKVITTTITAFLSILMIILVNIFNNQSIIILSCQIILLSMIYIISNEVLEHHIKDIYEDKLQKVDRKLHNLKNKLINNK
jgi:hypothetical protein